MGTAPTIAVEFGEDHLRLAVRLTPKASRDGIDGPVALADGRVVLAARVRALPEKGKANAALEKLLAATFGVGKTQINVVTGTTARLKMVMIRGDKAALAATLKKLMTETA